MSLRYFLTRFLGAVLALFIANERHLASAQSGGSEPGQPEHKHALLIGCSHYEHMPDRDLKGPNNDVRELTQALVTRFGFPADHVRQLVGWPDEASRRPTRANILREFQTLAQRVEPNAHVVVYLSGHGTRVPIPESQTDPLDPKNPELDGFDEAFVAADARYVGGELQNLILDNEIGDGLDALRAKGAHVWALFDCCHSGTMARGASGEQSRELTAKELGVPDDVVQRAKAKAEKFAQRDKGASGTVKPEGLVDATVPAKHPGTLVAFYAAQPFETAPDLPCPLNAPAHRENFFGLMTYTTLQTLLNERPSTKPTYRELGQLVLKRYGKDRGSCGPTPTFSGDLDREVLGLREWPGRSQLILQQDADRWRINAGELQGLAMGSILAVFPPATVSAEMSRVGYVRVIRATPTSAEVEPCQYGNLPAIAVEKLQDLMRCEVVSRHLGDLRIRLAVRASDPESKLLEDAARKIVGQLSDKVSEFVEVCDGQSKSPAEWELCAVTPQVAEARFRWQIKGPRILLARRGEAPVGSPQFHATGTTDDETASPARAYQSYDPQDETAFRSALESDLLKIYTWQNLRRLSGRLAGNLADPSSDVKVELAAIQGPDDRSGGQPLAEPRVTIGQHLELRVKNDSTDKLWVTLVFLNANFLVDVLPTQQLNRPGEEGDALEPIRFGVTSRQPGTQAWLVIATSAEADSQQPDYTFLAQSALGKTPKEVTTLKRASTSPFESLALSIAGQKGAFRGEGLSPTGKNPTLVIRSWEAVPTSPPKP